MLNHFKSNSNLLKDASSITKFSSVDISEHTKKIKDQKQRTRNKENSLVSNKAVSFDKKIISRSISKINQKKTITAAKPRKPEHQKIKSMICTQSKFNKKKNLPHYLNKKINISYLNLESKFKFLNIIGCKLDLSSIKKETIKYSNKTHKMNSHILNNQLSQDSLNNTHNISRNFSFDQNYNKNSRNKTTKTIRDFKSIFVNSYSYFPCQTDEPLKIYMNNSLSHKANKINANSANNKSSTNNTTCVKVTNSTANYSKDNSKLGIEVKNNTMINTKKTTPKTTTNSTASNFTLFNAASPSNNNILNKNIMKQIEEIDHDLDKSLKEMKTQNSKSKKYNTVKRSFELFIKVLSNSCNSIIIKFIQKFLYSIHEIVVDYANENRKLKDLNSSLLEKIENINKSVIEKNDFIQKSTLEIDILRKKLEQLSYKSEGSANTNLPMSSNEKDENKPIALFSTINNVNNSNTKLINLNKSNINDLDALYFLDKVDMTINQTSPNIIPLLPLNSKLRKCKSKLGGIGIK